MSENSPFSLLEELRRDANELAAQGLSYSTQSAGTKNIAFVVNDIYFYCEAEFVKEVSVCENLMLVPQTKAWMRGLINSKGVLYSVSDLSLLAGYGRPTQANKGHLLLLNDESNQCALLVNRVVGFRYFEESQKMQEVDSKQELLDGLSAYVEAGYHSEGRDWFNLNVEKLLTSEQFREIQ